MFRKKEAEKSGEKFLENYRGVRHELHDAHLATFVGLQVMEWGETLMKACGSVRE